MPAARRRRSRVRHSPDWGRWEFSPESASGLGQMPRDATRAESPANPGPIPRGRYRNRNRGAASESEPFEPEPDTDPEGSPGREWRADPVEGKRVTADTERIRRTPTFEAHTIWLKPPARRKPRRRKVGVPHRGVFRVFRAQGSVERTTEHTEYTEESRNQQIGFTSHEGGCPRSFRVTVSGMTFPPGFNLCGEGQFETVTSPSIESTVICPNAVSLFLTASLILATRHGVPSHDLTLVKATGSEKR